MNRRRGQNSDPVLGLLLDAHGETYQLPGGYWVKVEAWLVDPKPEIPHGLRYSLTLHDRRGIRVLGFDNAHRVRIRRPRYATRPVSWDHLHIENKMEPYEFRSAGRLLMDFWRAVNTYLGEKEL